MDPSIVKKRSKKRKAPAPPNPFTGEVEDTQHEIHVSDDEDAEEVNHLLVLGWCRIIIPAWDTLYLNSLYQNRYL
jgi:hypothetical protein